MPLLSSQTIRFDIASRPSCALPEEYTFVRQFSQCSQSIGSSDAQAVGNHLCTSLFTLLFFHVLFYRSINYLSTVLLKTCGFELPAYNRFLTVAEERIPILTANAYYSQIQGGFLPISEADREEKEILSQYEILEYNNLFDKDKLSTIFRWKLCQGSLLQQADLSH